MSTSEGWLERLSRATEYRELQVIFSEMAALARGATQGPQLAASIDEAIRRLEQERLRDEEELQAFETEYASFKDQQKGVVGWFKRHLPLTETRRQELEHRDAVADQRAEILADNLIIARAQMIKEQLLPAETRRLGHRPDHWQQVLQAKRSLEQLAECARAARDLTGELTRSRQFVEQLSNDIEAFAAADFSSKEDRQRKDADLAAARGELATLRSEVAEEESLREKALAWLGQLVEEELLQKDSSLRELLNRVRLLAAAGKQAKDTETCTNELRESLQRLVELSDQRDALPIERGELEQALSRLRCEADEAQHQYIELGGQLQRHAEQHDVAVREAERAQSAVDAARRLHDAYRQEQHGQAEFDPAAGSGHLSAVQAELERLQVALQQAEDQLCGVAATYESAKSRAEDAKHKMETLEQQVDETRRKLESLAQRETDLRHEISVTCDHTEPLLARLKEFWRRHEAELRALAWHSTLPSLESLRLTVVGKGGGTGSPWSSVPQSPPRHQRPDRESVELLERFLKSLQDNTRRLALELSDNQQSWKHSWTRRCHELLGADLADDVCRER